MTKAYLGLPIAVLAGLVAGACNHTTLTAHRDGGASKSPFGPSEDGTCQAPSSPCGSGSTALCHDLDSDVANCGACGHACTPGVACVAGVCQQTRCTGSVAFHEIASFPRALPGTADRPYSTYLGADLNRDGRLDFVESDATGALALWLGQGDGNFVQVTSYTTVGAADVLASSPWYAAVADFNEDGLMDLMVSISDDTSIALRPGLPGGGFGGPPGRPLSHDQIADVDRDGHLDVLFVKGRPDEHPWFIAMLGRGDGTFATGASYQAEENMVFYAGLLDWNGDGAADLVLMGTYVTILAGRGDGTFAGEERCAVGCPFGAKLADLNQDGKLDPICLWSDNRIGTLLGEGNCDFPPRITYKLPSEPSGPFTVGDLNGDGFSDLIAATFDSAGGRTGVALFLGVGDGTFTTAGSLRIDSDWDVFVADVNGDGRADIVSASNRGIVVYSNACER